MMRDAADPSEPTLADPPPRFATADEIELAVDGRAGTRITA